MKCDTKYFCAQKLAMECNNYCIKLFLLSFLVQGKCMKTNYYFDTKAHSDVHLLLLIGWNLYQSFFMYAHKLDKPGTTTGERK